MENIDLAVGLVHYPIMDRAGTTVATNVTNFDIHDIARASRTFDCAVVAARLMDSIDWSILRAPAA